VKELPNVVEIFKEKTQKVLQYISRKVLSISRWYFGKYNYDIANNPDRVHGRIKLHEFPLTTPTLSTSLCVVLSKVVPYGV